MGWGHTAEISRPVFNDKTVTVADAGIEPVFFIAKRLFYCRYQLGSFGRTDIAGGIVHHCFVLKALLVGQSDEIAAERDVGVT